MLHATDCFKSYPRLKEKLAILALIQETLKFTLAIHTQHQALRIYHRQEARAADYARLPMTLIRPTTRGIISISSIIVNLFVELFSHLFTDNARCLHFKL